MLSMKETLFPHTDNEEIAARIKAALKRLNTAEMKASAAILVEQWFDEKDPVQVRTGYPHVDDFGMCAIIDALMICASILALKEKELE